MSQAAGSSDMHDVIVVGGGLVGAVTALGLATRGSSVLLVDRAEPGSVRGRFDMDVRNIACSPASRALLEDVGVFRSLVAAPYRRMEVWEEHGTAELVFDAGEVGREELGWILENGPTLTALWEQLRAADNVDILLGELTALDAGSHEVSIVVSDQRLRARLLVGVDGARSMVRQLVGTGLQLAATGHKALATLVRTEAPHEGVAYQRFLLDGPLALLPSREPHVSSVVWSQSPELAEARSAGPGSDFCEDLGRAIEHRLGRVLEVDARLAFPLQQQVARDFNPRDRVLLIGDAARVMHPLAGLGANVGFEDVRDLLTRMALLPSGGDPGLPGLWRSFARKRRVRAQMMVAAMTGLRQAYAEGGPLGGWLRNTAIGWVDRTLPVKRQIIREALGLGPMAGSW